jgi:hypothetical protein
MLRHAQHEDDEKILTLSLSKGEARIGAGGRNDPADHCERRTPRARASGRTEGLFILPVNTRRAIS